EVLNVTDFTTSRQLALWKREDLQSPQLDDVAEEVPVALVYNGKNITTRNGFYGYVASFGETRIRNKGGENEYIAVKLPEDKKFT
ncbi:hypothetical protein MJM28_31130, partial [Salmonella enterica subsp. enterica serovar Montevideo]|nr:hypothetical protein [Salmonella enterica subsp. enterica serovar Montevideo]